VGVLRDSVSQNHSQITHRFKKNETENGRNGDKKQIQDEKNGGNVENRRNGNGRRVTLCVLQ
jgi:hypothetical protein